MHAQYKRNALLSVDGDLTKFFMLMGGYTQQSTCYRKQQLHVHQKYQAPVVIEPKIKASAMTETVWQNCYFH
jgi:hypothetical protein